MKTKAQKILDEIGNNISSESREAILSIDRLEKKIAQLESEQVPAKPAPTVEAKSTTWKEQTDGCEEE